MVFSGSSTSQVCFNMSVLCQSVLVLIPMSVFTVVLTLAVICLSKTEGTRVLCASVYNVIAE